MKRVYLVLACVLCIAFSSMGSPTYAQDNKFGIHVAVPDDADLDRAEALVNGDTGAYGSVSLVIQEDNRDTHYWQQIFDKLRERRLIPLVRLATRPVGENWRAPDEGDARVWADFLGSLNWVTRERRVMLYNEPNHAAEWGGSVNPSQYGRVAAALAHALKSQSQDYVIMLAGLDLAAPESRPIYADAHGFLQEAIPVFCEYFSQADLPCRDFVDAIASHSYPNPGFAGSPYATGRTSIRGYEYEIGWYESLIHKTLPVYITETGWDAHTVGQATVADYFDVAFRQVWLPDDRIRAVTPFILNYQGDPFLPFSFFTRGDDPQPLPQYERLRDIHKVVGTPDIIDTASVNALIPRTLVEGSTYSITATVRNTGQAIWERGEYSLQIITTHSPAVAVSAHPMTLPRVTPGGEVTTILRVSTGARGEKPTGDVSLLLTRGEDRIASTPPHTLSLSPRPSLLLSLSLLPKGLSTGDDFEIQIFDVDERLVYKQSPVKVTLGHSEVRSISNIVPGSYYRIVVLKPYYLPRQVVSRLDIGENTVVFEPLLPFDFDRDGKFSVGDLRGLVTKSGASDRSFFEKMQLLLP